MNTDEQCPHCDNPRGHNRHGIMSTCGADKCFRASCRAKAALYHLPWGEREIDFQNGFAAHNLRFRPARHKVVT